MKTNSTRELRFKKSVLFILFALLFLLSLSKIALSQPDYSFTTYSKISGTNYLAGAKYRFTNVKPGLDAIVTIITTTGGVTIANLDGGSGYAEALQPVIDVPANASGYAEFTIDFVTAGTLTNVIQTQISLTPIDVDGDATIKEYDMIKRSGGFVDYNMGTPELTVNIGSWVTGLNVGGLNYTGIDTSQRNVMFSVTNSNVSTITFRVGAQNSGAMQQRLRSVYFKRFTYNNSFLLPISSIRNFKGARKDSQVDLQWQLTSTKDVSTIVIEKATSPSEFNAIGEMWIDAFSVNENFKFKDNLNNNSGNVYYRLKLLTTSGRIEYSTVVSLKSGAVQNNELTFYPTVFKEKANVSIASANGGSAQIQLVDYAGRMVSKKDINLQKGYNNITIDNLGSLQSGNYIAVVKTQEGTLSKKVIKQ